MFFEPLAPPPPSQKEKKTKHLTFQLFRAYFRKKNAPNCWNVKNVVEKMFETAETLKTVKMLNVFWTIGPPSPLPKREKNKTFNISAVSSIFSKNVLETAEMLKMLKEKCSKLLKC